MQAIVRALRDQALPAHVCAVIASRADAAGLEWARSQGIDTQVVANRDHASREAFDQALGDAIDAHAPDYVLLAGFMRILTPGFVQRFQGRIVNIHPSLLPLFPGLHTHQQALDAGVRWHGCTVHFVTPRLDHGPIVAQGMVPVRDGDDADVLAGRVLQIEHVVYAQVACWLAQGRVAVDAAGHVQVAGVPQRAFVLNDAGVQVQPGSPS